ncbi:MAG: hypothetical protein DMD70_06110 [Gemmatimonadetes bacterium]|nr:MAG: hypothetical protein DMD70_06110 [Gemmatimonadota bacterium]
MARLHVHALRRVPTPHVVAAVCDTSEASASGLAELAGAVPYGSLAELLRDVNPDVVHVCTPAGMHFAPARQALLAEAHVYVEKPFVEIESEARELLALARDRDRLVCAGHQQLRDPAYLALRSRIPALGPVARVDSHFAFRPVGLIPERAGPKALAAHLLDILPHPLYTLANGAYGRLSVSLRARPVASTLSVSGTGGMLVADFIRTSVVGAANPGTGPLEKAANPLLEGWQTAIRGTMGVVRHVVRGGDYPGLAELIDDFYAAVAGGGPSPLSPDHLARVTAVYAELAANVRSAAQRAAARRAAPHESPPGVPLAVVTGARGFFGKEITRELVRRGFRVRGITRAPDTEDPNVHEWRALDLGRPVPPGTFAGAVVVVHAAVDTSGGYDGHQRNTIDATRHVLEGMSAAGVARLVYVSSLSVLRPPRTPWERQNEDTPLAAPDARQFGSYSWGKTEAERLVAAEAARLGIETRVLRPAALVDWTNPDMPGLVGRRLFGPWHLGFGRPGLPFAVCEVGRAAAVVAWCAARFPEAPPVLNLIDPAISTRQRLLQRFHSHGWRGRMVWLPISLFALLFTAARVGLGLATLRIPSRLAVWSIFRPRRYDTTLSARVLQAAAQPESPAAALEPQPQL